MMLVVTWLILVALVVASWTIASPAVSLAVAIAKTMLIALVFMGLGRAHTVDRTIAVIAVFFVVLLVVGSLGDVAFR
jgi:caa(3)-type oxidase subunit IV